ncbi:MAG: PAS domain-containing protein [Pseudomonadota bacterium]
MDEKSSRDDAPAPEIADTSDGLLQAILDAMPVMAFVLDGARHIRTLNRSAARTFGLDASEALERAVGDVVACASSGLGCGNSVDCGKCEVRGSVQQAIDGQHVHRVRTRKTWRVQGGRFELSLLVTAAPFVHQGRALVLLTLEDVTDLVALRGLLPICSYCKKIRQESSYWVAVEQYVQQHSDALFTHTICEECLDLHHPGVRAKTLT